MQVDFKPDFPVTDAACQKATGKTLQAWYKELDKQGGLEQKRRDAVNWLYGQMNKDIWWSTTTRVEYERARGQVDKKDGRVEGYNICVTKTIATPLEVAYGAWSNEATFRKWFGDKAKAKVVEKGTISDTAGNSGEYLRVRENKDLRFTWNHDDAEAPTVVDVTFADKGKGKTLVTLMHNRIQNRAEADGLRAAWTSAFDKLKELLEKA